MGTRRRAATSGCLLRRSWVWERGFRLWSDGERCLVGRVGFSGKPQGVLVELPEWLPYPVHYWYLLEGVCTAMLQRRSVVDAGGKPLSTMVDVKFKQAYPQLWEHFTQTAWEDGSPREPSGLTIFVQDGAFKGLLKDNANELCLWVTAAGFFELLATLERQIGADAADWRVDRRRGAGVSRKK